tara:strand:+ start:11288 stop:12499 length:1212 start_codon:yes stop_codon:yes gene_type:complete
LSILLKVLKNQQKLTTKWISSLGTIIGLIIILITVELLIDFNPFIQQKISSVEKSYQVISKKIGELSFLSKTVKGFSKNEIEEIKALDNIKDIACFMSCNYQVIISVGKETNGIPSFYTLAFFESVPNRFLGESEGFSFWDSSMNEVPVILPKNYLDAYNYGLSLSMNTPQISESFLKKLRFNIEVSGNNKKKNFIGKVVGLSNHLNSIIVPQSFLLFTNSIYGEKILQEPTRLIVKTKDKNEENYIRFLGEKNYNIGDNSQQISLIQKIIIGLFSYQFIIAIIIISQGLLLLLFYSKIIIQSSKDVIKKLFITGYNINQITKTMEKIMLKLYALIFILSLVITIIIKLAIRNQVIDKLNIKLSYLLSPYTVFIWAIIIITFFITNRINFKKSLETISKQIYI